MNTKRFLALVSKIILVSTLPCTVKPEKYTEKKEFTKIGDLYGNKNKNLAILDSLTKKEKIQKLCKKNKVSLAIPEFQGISHEDVLNILKNLNINLQKRWEKILSFVKDQQEAMLKKQESLPKEFLEALNELANDIEKASDNVSLPENITNFIKKANNATWHLMVRSTGKEDSEEVANAGGNESVANVNPDEKSILSAILTVVASYVRPKSITQRLDAGDKTIFDFPFVPVLLQRMIGEKIGGVEKGHEDEIPTGCVVYTVEQSGKLKTITVMNTSFGHTEGVVNSSVGIDRFYIDDTYKIFPVIKEKPTRLIPAVLTEGKKKFGLIRLDNQPQIIHKPSLSDDMVISITKITREIQKAYDGVPLDLEIVVNQKEKSIWLVQARPIQSAQEQTNPSYISDFSVFSNENIIDISSVHPASSAVLSINNANQVITGKTLEDALHTYLLSETIKKNIIAVIVEGDAEQTSHAAAIFRGAGIAIIVTEDIKKIKELLDKKEISLLIDVQQEKIIDLAKENKKFENLTVIENGWITFPVPLEKTVSEKEPVFGPEQPANLSEKSFKDLIYTLKKTTNSGEFIDNVDAIAYKLKYAIYKTKTDLSFVIDKIQKTYQDATKIAQQLRERFGEKPGKEFDLERLYYIKQLEALLFQKTRTGLVNVFSYNSLQAYLKKAQKFIEKQLQPALDKEKLSEKLMNDEYLFNLAMNGYDCASSEELGGKWALFINTMCDDKKSLPDFITMTHVINDLNMLPLWINVSFAQNIKISSKALDVHTNLYQDFLTSKNDLTMCKKLMQAINTFDINSFENPENFKTQLSLITKNIFTPLKKDTFLKLVKNPETPMLTVFAVIEVMKSAVDQIDLAIKALTGSTNYKDKEIDFIQNFEEMLNENHNLFITWSTLVSSENAWKRKTIKSREEYLKWLEKSFETIKKQFKEDEDQKEKLSHLYEPSNFGFSVDQAVFDAKGGGMLMSPKTYVDMFTLLHQNLIGIIHKLLMQHKVELTFQPSLLINYKDELKTYLLNMDTFFAGISFSDHEIIETYNIPLQIHSGAITLKFNKKVLWVTIKFLGNDSNGRWSERFFYFNILSVANKTPLIESKLTSLDLVVTLKITHESDTTSLHKDINYFLGELARGQIKEPNEKIDALHSRYIENFKLLKPQEKNTLINILSDYLKNNKCTVNACILFIIMLVEQGSELKEILSKPLDLKNQSPLIVAYILTNKKLIQEKKITIELVESQIDNTLNSPNKSASLDFIETIINSKDLIDANMISEKTINKILLMAQKEDNIELIGKIITSEPLITKKCIDKKTITDILEKLKSDLMQTILLNKSYYDYLYILTNLHLINNNLIAKEYIDEIITSMLTSTNKFARTRFLEALFSEINIIKKQLISSKNINDFIQSSFQDDKLKKILTRIISTLLDEKGEELFNHGILTEELLKTIQKEFGSNEQIKELTDNLLKRIESKNK